MTIKDVQNILNKYNLSAKKVFGQNFLYDESVLEGIIDKSNLNKDEYVIEIGPGLGFLTRKLVNNAKKVLSYEIDPDMINILNKEFKDDSNLYIKNGDFLKSNIEEDITNYLDDAKEVKVIANLPYYITTPILLKLLEEGKRITSITCMVQKEVAERVCGKISTKDYNALSVLMQYYSEPSIVINVPSSSFYPAPDVNSAVLNIKLGTKELIPVDNEQYFLKFNRNIFALRRKTLVNNLKASYSFNKETIEKVLTDNNLKLTVRAEELSVKQICDLANSFYRVK